MLGVESQALNDDHSSLTVVKVECTREAVLSVTGCFEVQEDQAGVDDDRIVCLILVIRSYWLENQGRTELSDCPHSCWLVRSLNTHL